MVRAAPGKVAVRIATPTEEKTPGGLIVPSVGGSTRKGAVVSSGKGCWVSAGQTVFLPPRGGDEIVCDGEVLLVFNDDALLGVEV